MSGLMVVSRSVVLERACCEIETFLGELKMATQKINIRQILKTIGADRVRHNADGSWDALWYKHPHNIASNGHYVLIGCNDAKALDYLIRAHGWGSE